MATGKFFGIGVGPGNPGLIPLAAVEVLRQADVVLAPRARSAQKSVARACVKELGIADDKFREVVYNMDATDRGKTIACYRELAREIAGELVSGKTVAYLTIGDSLTYSTYGYALSAVREILPDAQCLTIPGITSYAAVAAALNWPLGQGKERLLILPCPDSRSQLKSEIEDHDIVVLMKIGERLPMVIELLNQMGIADQCAVAHRIGHPDEQVSADINAFAQACGSGYLTTMLIRSGKRD